MEGSIFETEAISSSVSALLIGDRSYFMASIRSGRLHAFPFQRVCLRPGLIATTKNGTHVLQRSERAPNLRAAAAVLADASRPPPPQRAPAPTPSRRSPPPHTAPARSSPSAWVDRKAAQSATLEAARSSSRGGGWGPSGWASPWECRAARSRQARAEEAQGASWGTAKEAKGGALYFTMLRSGQMV